MDRRIALLLAGVGLFADIGQPVVDLLPVPVPPPETEEEREKRWNMEAGRVNIKIDKAQVKRARKALKLK